MSGRRRVEFTREADYESDFEHDNEQEAQSVFHLIKKVVRYGCLLALIVILCLAAVFGLDALSLMNRMNTTAVDVIELHSAGQEYKAVGGSYAGINMSVLCSAEPKLLPSRICAYKNSGFGGNPYGGDYRVLSSSDGLRFGVVMTNLDERFLPLFERHLTHYVSNFCESEQSCTVRSYIDQGDNTYQGNLLVMIGTESKVVK